MNIALFAPYARYVSPHFETELEIIENHLDSGDQVTVLGCNGELDACDVNANHASMICAECRSRRRSGLRLLSRPVRVHPVLRPTPEIAAELDRLRHDFSEIDELTSYHLEHFDLGYAVFSSIVTLTRDPEVDLVEHAALLRNLLRASWLAYRSVQCYLRNHQVDRMYVFNGRFAPLRAALRACQAEGTDCFVHERGHDMGHYAFYENTLPHDLDYRERQIRTTWDHAGQGGQREAIARTWYERRAQGEAINFTSFVENQRPELLPDGWDPAQRNVVVFTSSEDEFVAIGDSWRNSLYATQLEGIQAILASLQEDPAELHLYVRMHPNLTHVDNPQTRAFAQLTAPQLSVIPADDPVSTYHLMKHADTVLTFGSTAGIEAAYWGTPSILAGPSFYANLGATYNPRSHAELMRRITSSLEPKDVQPALMYGYYCGSFGKPFRHFQASGVFAGTFHGKTVRPGPLVRAQRWVLNRPASLQRKLLRIRRAVRWAG
jgi:hypothetical protein